LWQDSDAFREQVATYFNDDKPLLPFEKYRRRRVMFRPVGWRIGGTALPDKDFFRRQVSHEQPATDEEKKHYSPELAYGISRSVPL